MRSLGNPISDKHRKKKYKIRSFDMTIALYCLIILAIMPYIVIIPAKMNKSYDNNTPRLSSAYKEGFAGRSYSAHQNCMEAFPIFAVAVLTVFFLNPDSAYISWCAVIYTSLRILYVLAYYFDQAKIRSIVWTLAFATNLYIFTLSA